MMNALIIGLGNIGLRHLQGLSNLNNDEINVYLFDKSNKYFSKFKNELKSLEKKIAINFVSNNINNLSKINFDITIISTDASQRIEILNNIVDSFNSRFILLEKPICNSIKDLEILKKSNFKNVYVNFPRRYCNWHNKIKKKIINDYSNHKLKVEITGRNLGIACNISHYVDLIHSWTGQYPIDINHSELSNWKKTKREGFFDLDGKIKVTFRKNHVLNICSDVKYNSTKINITGDNNNICLIDYKKGSAIFKDKVILNGNYKLQSDTTNVLYEKLINKKIDQICDLKTAVRCYEKILYSFIEHWNKRNKSNLKQIMIT